MDPFKAALGLAKSASREEIKRAYRKLALQFHPDKHSHSPASIRDAATRRFKFVSQAYEDLMHELKRGDNNHKSSSNNEYQSSSSSSNNNNENNNNNNKRSSNNNDYQSSSSSNNNERNSSNNERSSNNDNNNDNGRRSDSRSGYRHRYRIDWSFIGTWRFTFLLYLSPFILAFGLQAIDYASWKMKNPWKSYEDYELVLEERRAKAALMDRYEIESKVRAKEALMAKYAAKYPPPPKTQ